ncbi:MAG TPA: NAD(P)H-binding protein [Pseudonocardiaceae bacterium]|nr:NAD(P)H-binding protein [Pseudonocardiaceae bacterium]
MTDLTLLTGGTGTLGSRTLPLLRAAGVPVRVLSRGEHPAADGVEYVTGDLTTGDGIEAALDGVHTVVHCAGAQSGDEDKARVLVKAASAADVRHIVNISVVGAERIPVNGAMDKAMFGYFAMKLATEQVIADSGVPWTTLRATQFHTLVLTVARAMAKLPVVPVPTGFVVQPVDADDVAQRLTELALGEPAGLVDDIAGPTVYRMADLIRGYLAATGTKRPLLPIRLPGRAAKAFRAGGNVAPDHATGKRSWEEFLAANTP